MEKQSTTTLGGSIHQVPAAVPVEGPSKVESCRKLFWALSLAPRGVGDNCWSWLHLTWSEEEGSVENFQITECQRVNRDVNQRCQPAYAHILSMPVTMASTIRLTRFCKYFFPTMVGWWLLLQIFWLARCGHTASASSSVHLIGQHGPLPTTTLRYQITRPSPLASAQVPAPMDDRGPPSTTTLISTMLSPSSHRQSQGQP
jgi:hypothetical protein